MPTIKQLIRNTRQPIRNVTKSPALRGCPQRRGTCTRVYVRLVQILGWDKIKKTFFQYQWSVPMNRIKWKNPIHYLKIRKSIISLYCVWNLWFPLVQIQSPEFKMKKEFPIGIKWLSIKRGKSYLKNRKIRLPLLQERTNRVSYPANFHN